MIKKVYTVCKKKNIKFGISPDGNIDNNYHKNYADVRTGLKSSEYLDFIMPQIYYGFYNSTKGYTKVTKEFTRPDLSWVGNGYGDEDEVPALWKDFGLKEQGFFGKLFNSSERTVTLWNRTYKFSDGPLPVEITAFGKQVLDKLPELLIDEWSHEELVVFGSHFPVHLHT